MTPERRQKLLELVELLEATHTILEGAANAEREEQEACGADLPPRGDLEQIAIDLDNVRHALARVVS